MTSESATKYDEAVTSYTSGIMRDGGTNIVLQDVCPNDFSEHIAVAFDPVVLQLVLNALDPEHATRVTCSGAHRAMITGKRATEVDRGRSLARDQPAVSCTVTLDHIVAPSLRITRQSSSEITVLAGPSPALPPGADYAVNHARTVRVAEVRNNAQHEPRPVA